MEMLILVKEMIQVERNKGKLVCFYSEELEYHSWSVVT